MRSGPSGRAAAKLQLPSLGQQIAGQLWQFDRLINRPLCALQQFDCVIAEWL